MCMVFVEPANESFPVERGCDLLTAAFQAGWKWPSVCYGEGQCAACWVEVLSGADRINAVTNAEAEGLRNLRGERHAGRCIRLACQLTPFGDIRVRKKGAAPPAAAA